MKKLTLLLFVVFTLFIGNNAYSQFNCVVETATGTWCVFCPQGHQVTQSILDSWPNTLVINYYGMSNSNYYNFNGNDIFGYLGVPFWPSGTVNRRYPMSSRALWIGWVATHSTDPPGVSISVNKTYNSATRTMNATFTFTALQTLTGVYHWDPTLIENNIIGYQNGGGNNYVHKCVTRDKIRGALGEVLISGTWNSGQQIVRTISNYVVSGSWDANNCQLLAFAFLYTGNLAGDSWVQQGWKQNLITGLGQEIGTPVEYKLSQNYPNPFNPVTNIHYSIPKSGNISFKVYNMLGHLVATMFEGYQSAGSYNVDFNGSDLASGVYFYTLTADGFNDTKKMTLVK